MIRLKWPRGIAEDFAWHDLSLAPTAGKKQQAESAWKLICSGVKSVNGGGVCLGRRFNIVRHNQPSIFHVFSWLLVLCSNFGDTPAVIWLSVHPTAVNKNLLCVLMSPLSDIPSGSGLAQKSFVHLKKHQSFFCIYKNHLFYGCN